MTDPRPPSPAALLFSEPPRSWPLAAELSARVEALAARLGVPALEVQGGLGPAMSQVARARTIVHLAASAVSDFDFLEQFATNIRFFQIAIEPAAPDSDTSAHSGRAVHILAAGRSLADRVESAVDTAGALLDAALCGEDPERHPLLTLAPDHYQAHARARGALVPGLERHLLERVRSKLSRRLRDQLEPSTPWEAEGFSLDPALTASHASRTTIASYDPAAPAGATAHSPVLLHRRAIAAADALSDRVARELQAALRTHGLGAVGPMRRALQRLITTITSEQEALAALPTALPAPLVQRLDAATRACGVAERAVAALSPPIGAPNSRGAGWLAASHLPPIGAVGALALAPAVAALIPQAKAGALAAAGGPWLVAGGLALGLGALGLGLAALAGRLTRARRERELMVAFEHRERARREHAQATLLTRLHRVLGPAQRRLLEAVEATHRQLVALEAALEPLARRERERAARHAGPGPMTGSSSGPTATLLDRLEPPVEPWDERIRDALADLPAAPARLGELARDLERAVLERASWRTRRDAADLLQPLAESQILSLDRALREELPGASAAHRFLLMPRALWPSSATRGVASASTGQLDGAPDATLAPSREGLVALALTPARPPIPGGIQ